MLDSVEYKSRLPNGTSECDKMYVHEYRFEYDVNGKSTLKQCLIDIVIFISGHSRDEAAAAVNEHFRFHATDRFSMFEKLGKSKLRFHIDDLDVTVTNDGEILVRTEKTLGENFQNE
ncbi:hypothetical protein [Haladaptatus litoreus]|uniref:hypothetical protein n=1 Tax=Haladaptatus litoreus TaxID=553468 RepID=UPI000971036A|nr:hypothetical protein [Haladaptatus litoreus]